jgi:hypothetical protein
MQRILITGAAGDVGSRMTALLRDTYQLRLSDIRTPAAVPGNAEFIPADLTDLAAVRRVAAGMDGIIHLGGFSVEGPWDTILNANIVGCYNLFEAARAEKVGRIVFASSNHAVGFYPRQRKIGTDVPVRPDSRYGVSKAFGEALGAFYAYKHGLRVTCLRIGNVADGWPSGCDPRTSRNWYASASNTQASASRFSTAPPTTNGPGGTTEPPSASATGQSSERRSSATMRLPPRLRCLLTRSATGTRAEPSAARSTPGTSRRSIRRMCGLVARTERSVIRASVINVINPAIRLASDLRNAEIESSPCKTARGPCAQSLGLAILVLDGVAQNVAHFVFHAADVTGGAAFEPHLHVIFQIAHDDKLGHRVSTYRQNCHDIMPLTTSSL